MFSMAWGAGENERAEKIIGSVTSLLIGTSLILFVFCYALRRPVLYLFGASDASYVYADAYLKVYLFGTVFSMIASGLNGFINAQGFPKMGMFTITLGAVLNLILDPVFIFVLDMGVAGAALATVISQAASALWVLLFLTGKKAVFRIRKCYLVPELKLTGEIIAVGMSGFIMQGTNCLVQVLCNATLRTYGGDLYVGIMTVINSVRDILSLPVSGVTNGARPVLGFNYGARKYDRVKKAIEFTSIVCIGYTLIAWGLERMFPMQILSVFTNDPRLLEAGIGAMNLYFYGFFFMAFQFTGQSVFTGLGFARRAVWFSLFRKAVIVAPLTIFLPKMGLGVNGIFIAEPIPDLIGGLACFITMYFTVYRKLKDQKNGEPARL